MSRIILIISLILCYNVKPQAQFFDDFSDSDLNSNPIWEGDLQDFIVNSSNELQLNAPEGGMSELFTQFTFPDSIVWEFEANLDFSPSDNNGLRIYLALDNINLTSANGYFLEIGENGSNDDVKFYFLNEGVEELIASGSLAAVATEPAYLKGKVQYFPDGMWLLESAYLQNGPFTDMIEFSHNEYDFSGNQIFRLQCSYTASRSDKFTFDNIGVKKFELDKQGPEILSAQLVDASTIDIQCNEVLDLASVQVFSNYNIQNFNGSVNEAVLISNNTGIRITLSEPLSGGTVYLLTVKGIKDENLNESGQNSFDVFLIDEAEAGDLVVNEILFNPETSGVDFVEILNISDKFITLENLAIANFSKNDTKNIGRDVIIKPGKYLCLSDDVNYLKDRYSTPDSASFLEIDIPSFNNDGGNVSIVHTISSIIIDAFDYSEDYHFQELDDLNGVSLERINPFGDSQSKNNWFSASSAVSFATPGYKNSVFLNPDFSSAEMLAFESKTFSPNHDGMDDQLVIKFTLPENGYLVDINIYDQVGRKVRTLVNNELFSTEGLVLWDGVKDSGELGDIGIYFIIMEAFNGQGNVIKAKKPAILADYLD